MGGQGVTSNDTRSKAHVPEKNGAVNVRRKRHGRNGSLVMSECQKMSDQDRRAKKEVLSVNPSHE
jgi:hypothetical protein